MEGRGFLEAVRANADVDAIVIRGISNLLDEKTVAEEQGSQELAATHTAAFLFEMLSKLKKPRQVKAFDNTPLEAEGVEAIAPQAAIAPLSHNRSTGRKDERIKTASLERLYSVLTGSPSPLFLLGGGTAVKSGISLSDGLVEKAVRWQHCRDKGISFDDPRVVLRLSDWLPELRKQPWFGSKTLQEAFPQVIRHLLHPRENRREFFRRIMDTAGVPASIGYERLAEFMALEFVMVVLTTNFDRVFADLCHRRRRPHYVDIIDSASTLRLLRTSPKHPLITYLYGSTEDYLDRFDGEEDKPVVIPALVQRLIPFLRDHPLIVAGYGGAEEVIMRDLLVAHAKEVDGYEQGIYWCAQNYSDSNVLHPLVVELAGVAGGNFQVVPIEGFDEMMQELWELHQHRQARPARPVHVIESPEDVPAPTFDLGVIQADIERELDWANMKTRLVNYYDVWEMPLPVIITDEWLKEELCRQHLAEIVANGQLMPTTAGYLLFGRKPHERVPASLILLRVAGEEEQRIEGSLWNQLQLISDSLAEVNKSFLLKGEKSETVYPYPPTALREVVVNALVHRDYSKQANIIVEIEDDCIRIINPGGLVEDVLRQTDGGAILEQIQQGARGIKGYRNPVIADFFYSSHDMEKKGSGLADVHRLVRENGGKVVFGPINENTGFEVVIYSRPEAVDKETGTAAVVVSTRYAANLLEVVSLPTKIWQAPASFSRGRDVWGHTDSIWLPPFVLHNQKIHTFFDLENKNNPLRDVIDIDQIGSTSVAEFSRGEDGERRLVWLMNECLYKHMEHCGLVVDKRHRRAYFPKHRDVEDKRMITYRSRLRKSTRTVTKPILSSYSGKVRYWEHQSFTFELENFSGTWALHVLSRYVFTLDGVREFLSGERVNVLSTKRASRDYNSKVHTDLIFWAWVLSGGRQGHFDLQMGPTIYDLQRQEKLPLTPGQTRTEHKRLVARLKSNLQNENQPQFTINSTLPTFTIHNLEEAFEDENESDNPELIELEDEISAILEDIEERFEGK